jgi:hypothetical protein
MKTPRFSHRSGFNALARLGLAPMVAALALLAPAGNAAEAGVELRPKDVVGQQMLNRMVMRQEQDITGAGMPGPMKQVTEQTQDITLKVLKELPEGGHELEVGYARMKMESRMGEMVALAFDSADSAAEDANNPAAPMLRVLVGSKFRLMTDARGKVVRVEGLKEVMESIRSKAPEMMGGMLEGMINEENIKQMGATAQGLPAKPVKVGDTWPEKQEIALGSLGNLVVNMTMTFKGWETFKGVRCARLDHTGTLTGGGVAGTNVVTLASLTGETTGTTFFDAEAGVTRESTSLQKMELKLKAMGQDITSQMT